MSVGVSAEVRWFWEGAALPALRAWFEKGPVSPGGGLPRTDVYLRDPNEQVGIKMRGENRGAEVKQLVATRGEVKLGALADRLTIWTKAPVENLHLGRMRTIATIKTRQIRKFDTSGSAAAEIALGADEQPLQKQTIAKGAGLELTSVQVGEDRQPWTTLGIEAFGSLEDVEESLKKVVALVGKDFPAVPGARALSYPAWLCGFRNAPRPEPASLQALLEQERRELTGGKGLEWKEIDRRGTDRA